MTQYDKNMGYCEEANTYCSAAEERYKQGRADALSIDMDKPMHFTDEQKTWIKNYIIINAKRQRADAIDEFMESMELWGNNIKEIRGTVPFFTIDNIRKMAEQLKENKND